VRRARATARPPALALVLALVLGAAGAVGCGKYGPPVRTAPDAREEAEEPAAQPGTSGAAAPQREEER